MWPEDWVIYENMDAGDTCHSQPWPIKTFHGIHYPPSLPLSINWLTNVNTQEDFEAIYWICQRKSTPPHHPTPLELCMWNNFYCFKPLRFRSFSFTTVSILFISNDIQIFFFSVPAPIELLSNWRLSLAKFLVNIGFKKILFDLFCLTYFLNYMKCPTRIWSSYLPLLPRYK